MKKSILILAAIALTVASCKDSEVVYDPSNYGNLNKSEIEFSNFVGGMTRASYASGASFKAGDEMGVYGFQTTGDIVDTIFKNKSVIKQEGEEIWYYTPKVYWNIGSIYDFYAMFPKSESNSFDYDEKLFSVAGFTVALDKDEQVDLMIAKRILNRNPGNAVNFEFNHILSNVSFYFKPADDFDTEGIESVEMVSFDVKNLYGTGSFAQTDWSDDAFVGAWTADEEVYDLPQVKDVTFNVGEDKKAVALANDLLLLPQTISDDAVIEVVYKINYSEDNTSTRFTKTVNLNKISGLNNKAQSRNKFKINEWEPNYRYNYTLSMNPSKGTPKPQGKDDFDQEDYENTDDPEDLVPTVTIIQLDEDLDEDGMNDFWIDEDNDGNPDYPVIWKDIDDDGKEEALADRDGDGEPDDTDGDGNPDVIWFDSDPTDDIDAVDTELEREYTITGKDGDLIDYDGGIEGYKNATGTLMVDGGDCYVDADGNGVADYTVLWKDIDGDGKLEGIADKDGDGKLSEADTFDGDGKDYLGNDNDYDVILIYREGEDPEWIELEKTITEPEVPEPGTNDDNSIEFSAEVEEWKDDYNADHNILGGN